MKHYGDITKLKGAQLPIVDIVTGGSPCQDLSVAGKRTGLAGERSGLFVEQIRIIKEMRKHDADTRTDVDIRHFIRPRYMVWENVPGAFSSNHGEDFRAVLEETARVADQDAVISGPPKGGWSPAGCIMGDGWSIAWRVHDAQFWGVPQRRRRIALVADFGGITAPEILFERKSVPGDPAQSTDEKQDAAAGAAGCPGKTSGAVVYGISGYTSNAMLSNNPHSGIYEADTTRTLDLNGGSPACNQGGMIVLEGNGQRDSHKGDEYKASDVMYTLNTVEQHAVCVSQDAYDKYAETDTGASLKASGGNYGGGYRKSSDTVGALCARDHKGVSSQYVSEGKCIIQSFRKSSS